MTRVLVATAALLLSPVAVAQGAFGGAPQPYDGINPNDTLTVARPVESYGRAPVRLVYDHVDGSVTLLDARGSVRETWAASDGVPFADVPTDRPVVVEVRNANALVCSYDIEATVRETLPAPPSCRREAQSLTLAGATIAARSFSGNTEIALGGGAFQGLLGGPDGIDLSGVDDLLALRGGNLSADDLESIRSEREEAIRDYDSFADRMARTARQAYEDVRLAALRGDVEPVGPLLADIQAQLDRTVEGLSDPARIPLIVKARLPNPEVVAEVVAAASAVRAGEVDDPTSFEARQILVLDSLARTADSTLVAAADSIQSLALRVRNARRLSTQSATVRPNDDLREVAVVVDAMTQDYVRTPTRETTVRAFLGPDRSGRFGCSVMVALTAVPRLPSFGLRQQGDELVVVDDTEDGLDAAPAVLFEVAPPGIGPVLGGVVGVGLGANFAPNLYLGGSLRVLAPVIVTGGLALRRADTLPDGLSVGSVVDSELFPSNEFRDDDLGSEWSRAFFFGISFGQ